MKERIYIVEPTKADTRAAPRLIRAGSRAQARGHVTRDMFTVTAASALAVGKLMAEGVQLEAATAEVDPE